MSDLKLIVGLANPGEKYTKTRHNAGAWYINKLAKRYNQILQKKNFFGYTAHLQIGNKKIWLLIPTTFMNDSGRSVAAISLYYKIPVRNILIVHDELYLPPGIAKFKQNGTHGGHNGLKNIIQNLGNDTTFHRLRIGVGCPEDRDKLVEFVLGTPKITEQKLIDNAINEAIFCTEIWLKENRIKAISRLHCFRAI
ncbi:aminoacyl-tRNA hydrolase [Candidatus Erwinia haradaeae]|uniref:Peptidyl-tRNA hydrolase n=1 Tax=Candidatus Erwinia haradaeae TaxID=1922217 RepID=A0A451DI50_9GAMM|nr:aminoacyl-tRNA hydrolase [Candidatus Erwinia haradaeae]VFP86336.1 Peptidyl-tRNA hydrolase [Candidatus Erwinia haradaeae]